MYLQIIDSTSFITFMFYTLIIGGSHLYPPSNYTEALLVVCSLDKSRILCIVVVEVNSVMPIVRIEIVMLVYVEMPSALSTVIFIREGEGVLIVCIGIEVGA